MMSDDMKLVREYAESGSEQAFSKLVAQHINLVYSVALRQVRDAHLAEEITQGVFIILARKAKSLKEDTILSGWLCRTARYVSADTLKIQSRRQIREQEAHMQSMLNENEPEAWTHIAPILDDALGSLDQQDHDAVVLRYFEGKDLREVGVALGVKEDAARMRVNRGLEKLRKFFTWKGVALSVSAIAASVAANSVQAAPAGLSAAILTATVSSSSTASAVIAVTKGIAMTTVQKFAITAAFAALASAGIYEARQAVLQREQVRVLKQQQAPLAEQIKRLQTNLADATTQVSNLLAENSRLKANPHQSELMKLRGEVGQLKAEEAENTNNPIKFAAVALATRVAQLKQHFEQWPGKKTPEIALATDQEWLTVAGTHPLDSESDFRDAMSEIRTDAIEKFGMMVKEAVKQYADANNGQMPTSPLQLAPFLNLPTDLAMTILDGYQVAQPGEVTAPRPGPDANQVAAWAMLQKGGPADAAYDSTFVFYTGGWYYYGPNKALKR
jgi:RNA polymerase sigma factor (sigma-70 family)